MEKMVSKKKKAKAAAAFAAVMAWDKNGRPKYLVVPGSNGKRYRVFLHRREDGIHADCLIDVPGELYCPGSAVKNNRATVCYHVMAAVEKALSLSGYQGFWCFSEQDAVRLARMKKGNIIKVFPGRYETVPGAYLVVERTAS